MAEIDSKEFVAVCCNCISLLQFKSEYAFQLAEQMRVVHEYARKNLKITADTMKRRYDKNIHFHEYNKGDVVWLHDPTKKKGLSHKLRNHWKGPFHKVKKISDVTYRIQESQKSKPKVVHSDRLKPYLGENKQNWNVYENVRNEPFDKDVVSDRGNILLGESDLDAIATSNDVGIAYSDSDVESDVLCSGTNVHVHSKSDSRSASRVKDRANREKRPKTSV